MTPRTRTRLLWILAALTAAHALATVAFFAITGTFTPLALDISILVYAGLLVCAFVLLATTPHRRLRRMTLREAEPTREVVPEPTREIILADPVVEPAPELDDEPAVATTTAPAPVDGGEPRPA